MFSTFSPFCVNFLDPSQFGHFRWVIVLQDASLTTWLLTELIIVRARLCNVSRLLHHICLLPVSIVFAPGRFQAEQNDLQSQDYEA